MKAFNHLDARALARPEASGGQLVQFYSGDDDAAKADVRKILEAARYFPADVGALDVGGPLASLPFGTLSTINFVKT